MGWDDIKQKTGTTEGEVAKVNYTSMPERKEAYQIRLLDEAPRSRWTHWIPQANGGKGLGIDCPGKDCPICTIIKKERADKVTQKSYSSRKLHAINILNRESNQVEVLDKGNGLFEALSDIMEEIGDLRDYDIKIKVSGKDRDTSYTPIPMAKKALSADEKALVKYDLDTIASKFTPEQVKQLMQGMTFAEIFGDKEDDAAVEPIEEAEQGLEVGEPVDFTK